MQPLAKGDKIRILLVDDHIVMRMGLVMATEGEPDMEVVAEARDGIEALEAYRTHRPDVVVLDLRMPRRNGVETIRMLRQEFDRARIVVFSNYASGDEAFQAFRAGACGFVVKEMPLESLLTAIRAVRRGEQYIPPEISVRVQGRVLSWLSPREIDVLSLVAKGYTNKRVSAALELAETTVKVHVTNILDKLGAGTRTEAVLIAVKRGIIQLE